jgi:hypothetical protein
MSGGVVMSVNEYDLTALYSEGVTSFYHSHGFLRRRAIQIMSFFKWIT